MLIKKISAGLASGALLATMFAGSVSANTGNTCTITDNQFAYNKCKIKVVNKTKTVQVNNAYIKNGVYVGSSTGDNEIKKTNGGDNTITTGDSTVKVTITNIVNSNVINP